MPGNVQSIERAASVLRVLAGSGGSLRLRDIAELLDLPRSTTHGIVRTLTDLGFVTQDRSSGDYLIGAEMRHLSITPMDLNELRSRATNWVDALSAQTGLSSRLAVLPGDSMAHARHALVVHHVFRPDDTAQRLEVGDRVPLHASAIGKVLLALDPRGQRLVDELVLDRLTFRTVRDHTQLRRDLTATRLHGHAVDREEHTIGLASVAAPVRGLGGITVAALAVRGPVDALLLPAGEARPEVLRRVVAAAHGVSRAVVAERW